MYREVVRAGTWRKLADRKGPLRRSNALSPLTRKNWSLYLDLADVRAEQDDFTAAVEFVRRGQHHAPTEVTLKAAGAAYRARLTGSIADLSELVELAPQMPNATYRNLLIDRACDGPGLPAKAGRRGTPSPRGLKGAWNAMYPGNHLGANAR
jgi:hypothetical protein